MKEAYLNKFRHLETPKQCKKTEYHGGIFEMQLLDL